MFIKSIKLSNIRSYIAQEIVFPAGSVLLSGDIGSGKSTILLAMDFALFGIRKGTLSGASLLRHGSSTGSVELKLVLDKKDIEIKRTLKRANQSVVQDSGYVSIDSIKTHGTAQELRAIILDLLGYPKGLLTKSKDLLYRYTVYTPQEEMKAILYEDKESRLETLRKIFGIDKYKRIRENTATYLKELKQKRKQLEGQTEDLEEKRKQKNVKQEELRAINEKISETLPKFEKAKQELQKQKQKIGGVEQKLNKKNELSRKIEVSQTRLNELAFRNKKNSKELLEISEAIQKIDSQVSELKIEPANEAEMEIRVKEQEIKVRELESRITVKTEQLKFLRQKSHDAAEEIESKQESLKQLGSKKQELEHFTAAIAEKQKIAGSIKNQEEKITDFKTKLRRAQEKLEEAELRKSTIPKMNKCPTCLQDVTVFHKKRIEEDEEKTIKELNNIIPEIAVVVIREEKLLDDAKNKLNEIIEKEKKTAKLLVEISNLEKASEEITRKQIMLQQHSEQLEKINSGLPQDEEIVAEMRNELIILKEKMKKVIEKKNLNRLKEEKTSRKSRLETENNAIETDIGLIGKSIVELSAELNKFIDVEAELAREKHELDILSELTKGIEIEHARYEKEGEGLQKIIDMLTEEIMRKEYAQLKLKEIMSLQNWLEEHFTNLMIVIEKHVMSRIYQQFNELFRQWFNVLIEDESLQASLDDEFTPIIEQNGYESDVENLSGGEKTSLALAYRLSLNKVINDFIGTIKTKNLIILDEPTDGFSTEQLDKIRDVLDELNMQQVIIVSHESKIESFVENVIRVSKEEHISKINV